MTNSWNKRKPGLIKGLKALLHPFFRAYFRLEVIQKEELKATPTLYVSNHNIGALIESHSILFEVDSLFNQSHIVFGFTHPSIFRVPLIKEYYEWVGAVPATYEVAREVCAAGESVLIFPGGNKQALRSLADYKKNSFRDSHGWAKIAKENGVDVVPITFKGSHFVNPVFFQSQWLSKILVLPWILGLKWLSVSLGQILMCGLFIFLMTLLSLPWWAIVPLAIFVFSITPLTVIFPSKITMTFHSRLKTSQMSQDELEDKVAEIMNQIYDS